MTTSKWILYSLAIFGITILCYRGLKWYQNSTSVLPVLGPEDHKIEYFTLTDQLDNEFNSEDHLDKIWVVNYFFTSCPTICPKMIKNMQEVHDYIRSDDEIILLSVSIDPRHDTPDRLRQYTQNLNVNNESWRFLTGDKDFIYAMGRRSFLLGASDLGNDDNGDFVHSENIVVIDARQQIRGFVVGTEDDAEENILKILEKLKKEAQGVS